MSRPECWGRKEDHSDKCDFYDSEGFCHWYGDTWKGEDGVFRGGEEVERITYCTHRTRKGKRINDSMNPLYMERLLHWTEIEFNGRIRSAYDKFYNPEGIILYGDGTKYDPVSKTRILPDGTVIENDHGMTPDIYNTIEESRKHLEKRLRSEGVLK